MSSAAKFFEQATTHHQAGRLNEAERDYIEALKIDDRDADALRLLAVLYAQINQPERAIAFFERAHLVQPRNAETLNNLGVALRNSGRLDDAIARYEQALTIDPHYAQARGNLVNAYYERGNAFIEQGRNDEAGAWFEKVFHLEPRHFRALNNFGNLRRAQDKAEEAAGLFRQALAIRPDYAEAMANLGTSLRDLGKLDEAEHCYQKALGLKPGDADTLINLGTLLQQRNRQEEAVALYDAILRRMPDFGEAKWNKSLALLALGDYAEGWALHEAGLDCGRRGVAPFQVRRWDGREFPGRLLIWGEQGIGDQIQFVRYAALCKARCGEVLVHARDTLGPLLQNCPYIDRVLTSSNEEDFDYQISMMSLPYIFGTTLEDVPAKMPYLFVSEEARAKWAPKFAGVEGLKIGLVWAGNARASMLDAHLIDRRRSLHLSLMKPLFALQGARFYNLQMGDAAQQIDECGLRGRIEDFMPEVGDFLDTAAIIENLDLVISVDTSVAHLAGGLGKPVWILSRYDGCWRWLRNRETSPWYPTARVFGQKKPGAWPLVIDEVHQALCAL
jgi:tetratricopeptide (TPR) repeat protein